MRRCDSCRNVKVPLHRAAGRLLCAECIATKFFECEICKKLIYVQGFKFFSDKHIICNTCGDGYFPCEVCGEPCDEFEYICDSCSDKAIKKSCPICGAVTNNYEDKVIGDEIYCMECYPSKFAYCSECKQDYLIAEVNTEKLPYMCLTCMKECGVVD